MSGDRRAVATGPGPLPAASPDSGAADSDPPDTGPPGPAAVRALIRAQLRTALGTGAVVMAVVLGVPVLAALVPALTGPRLYCLALAAPLLWILLAFRQLSRAERAEHDLRRPVDGS